MAVLSKGTTFATGDNPTAATLNALVDSAAFVSGAVDNSTTQLSSGAIIVKDGGITPAKLSTGHPTWDGSGSLEALGLNNTPIGGSTPSSVVATTLTAQSTTTLMEAIEKATISSSALTGTVQFDWLSGAVVYYTGNAAANWTLNVRASSGVTLNNSMVTGDTATIVVAVTQGATPYYASALTIDGNAVTPKWSGGSAPTSGNASGIDVYVYTIIKTGSAAFTVLANQTRFA